jgi:hypothetical protein
MSYYIGEPRGNSQHPGSPDYDSRYEDMIGDECIEGDLAMRHCPGNLLRALADFLTDTDAEEDAVRELLLPLYAAKQSPALRKLHDAFAASDSAADVAALAIEREYAACA